MFEYYRVRYKSLRQSGQLLGHDLMFPVGLAGTVGFLLLMILTKPGRSYSIWSNFVLLPLPAAVFLACAISLFFLAYLVDTLPKFSLWTLTVASIAISVAALPGAYRLRSVYADLARQSPLEDPPSAIAVGLIFFLFGNFVAVFSIRQLVVRRTRP